VHKNLEPMALKVTQNDTLEYGVCKSLVFYWNYARILYHF